MVKAVVVREAWAARAEGGNEGETRLLAGVVPVELAAAAGNPGGAGGQFCGVVSSGADAPETETDGVKS
jgi:hypothetical protein